MSFNITDTTVDLAVNKTLSLLESTGTTGWRLSGNNISSNDFIGTTNDKPFTIKVNNKFSGIIDELKCSFGINALSNNTTGQSNSAFGKGALLNNISGNLNSAFGNGALFSNTNGGFNSAFGNGALFSNTNGWFNSAFGIGALESNVDGSFNSVIGFQDTKPSSNYNNIIAIGYNSELSITGSNQVRIGNGDITSASTQVGWTTSSDERLKSDIKDIDIGLEFINKLHPVSYYRINDENKKIEYGLIAQELQNLLHPWRFKTPEK